MNIFRWKEVRVRVCNKVRRSVEQVEAPCVLLIWDKFTSIPEKRLSIQIRHARFQIQISLGGQCLPISVQIRHALCEVQMCLEAKCTRDATATKPSLKQSLA